MKRNWMGRFTPLWLALAVSFATLALAQTPLPLAKPEEVGMSSQRLAKIGAALKKEADDGSFRGAVAGARRFVCDARARANAAAAREARGSRHVDAAPREDRGGAEEGSR